jgi:hypothetical protein
MEGTTRIMPLKRQNAKVPLSMLAPMVGLAILCLIFGIFVEVLMQAVAPAALLLLGGA